jgi:hypothetical protein
MLPHTSPHSARAIGLTDGANDAPEPPPQPHSERESQPEPEPEPQPWQFYLPTKFDESTGEAVQFPAFGWQNNAQRVALELGLVPRDIRDKQKHGQDRVVCAIMQPYHLFREYYLGRMNNRNCWTTKFFGLADMCEKLLMAKYFNDLAPLLGADCSLLHTAPKTFVLPAEREQLREFMQCTAAAGGSGSAEPRTMIVKPGGGSQGKGIFITDSLEDLEQEADHAAVAQEYIARPLLLDGLKFDLRVYVIVVGIGAQQQVYIAEEGLARFCTKAYSPPSGTIRESDWARDVLRAHLTNTAANKGSEEYDLNASKRKMSTVLQQLCEAGERGLLEFAFTEAAFWEQLEHIVQSWLALMRPIMGLTFRQASKAARSAALSRRKKSQGIRAFMAAQRAAAAGAAGAADPTTAPEGAQTHKEKGKTEGKQKAGGAAAGAYSDYEDYLLKCRSAQVLGFDVMLDASGKLHLLEVNNSPSLSTEEIVRVSPSGAEAEGAESEGAESDGAESVCTDVACEYSEGGSVPHIHHEGPLDRCIKTPVIEALLRLVRRQHDAAAAAAAATAGDGAGDGSGDRPDECKVCLGVRQLKKSDPATVPAVATVEKSLKLLEAAYCNHFLDTDDVGPSGWPSSCLLSFSQPVSFHLPDSFRAALVSLSTAELAEDADVDPESKTVDGMITKWDQRMKQVGRVLMQCAQPTHAARVCLSSRSSN